MYSSHHSNSARDLYLLHHYTCSITLSPYMTDIPDMTQTPHIIILLTSPLPLTSPIFLNSLILPAVYDYKCIMRIPHIIDTPYITHTSYMTLAHYITHTPHITHPPSYVCKQTNPIANSIGHFRCSRGASRGSTLIECVEANICSACCCVFTPALR